HRADDRGRRREGPRPPRCAARADGPPAREGRAAPGLVRTRRPACVPRHRRPARPYEGAAPSLHAAQGSGGAAVADRRGRRPLRPDQGRDEWLRGVMVEGGEPPSDPPGARGMRGRSPLNHWLEIAVPAHAEAVEAVSEILSRIGHNGIAVDMPSAGAGGRGAEPLAYTVRAYLV